MLSQLHQVLLGCGFHYTAAQQLPVDTPLSTHDKSSGFYVKNYESSAGPFTIALSFRGDPHIELPWACVLSYPDQYRGRLIPHLNLGWFLCYVQQMEADWDSNDLSSTYQAVDTQIQNTLDKAVSSTDEQAAADAEALEGEFAAYWLPNKTIYLLSDPEARDNLLCQMAIRKSAASSEIEPDVVEWIAFHANQSSDCQRWIEQRDLALIDEISFLTHHVRVTPSSLVGAEWPPKNFKALLNWLSDVDSGARSRVLECLARNPVKRHVLLLDVFQQDIVGLYVDINLKATSLSTYSKRSSHQKGKRRPVKLKTLAASLSSGRAVETFQRLGVIRADKQSILSRNRKRPEIGDLSSKRIALIGCGTTGGNLASLLLRAGAGCGAAHFHLFDDDTFNPHNFSRHPLSTSDFGHCKSIALANALNSSTHIACNVTGQGRNFTITPETMEHYDIIIDATGRPPVARRLAAVVRELKTDQLPVLIHGFNDGNGRASKVFIDNGQSCYGCLLSEPAFYKNESDIRFGDIDQHAERHVSCGSTYTPYDAAVSVITAGLMQEAALNCLEDQFPWTYSEHMLDGSRSRRPRSILSQPNCEICYGQRRTNV